MATASAPNSRASLLNGLRTGGVRSVSNPMNVPHTAAIGGSFNVPRYASSSLQYSSFPEEDMDEVGEIYPYSVNLGDDGFNRPMTASVDGANNYFQQQSAAQRGLNPRSVPFSPSFAQPVQTAASLDAQTQALHQMQMMQMEILRLQAQQAQASLLAEAMRQQMNQNRRSSVNFNPPASAGPMQNGFDLYSVTNSAQNRRHNQADMLKAKLGLNQVPTDEQVPMTAALGGKFGGRIPSNVAFPRSTQDRFHNVSQDIPPTPNYTTVISGGTSLGNAPSNNTSEHGNAPHGLTPSKSESVSSWRRGGNNSMLNAGNRTMSMNMASPTVKVTPPPGERTSSIAFPSARVRPRPLSFNAAISQPLPVVAVESSEGGSDHDRSDPEDTYSSTSSSSQSNPTTPNSGSFMEQPPLSPREEASKKLYEGLGLGRPIPSIVIAAPPNALPPTTGYRVANQPTRQPRGPPSGADELGPKNFASRIRRQAIGGLGVLMGARERREAVEVN